MSRGPALVMNMIGESTKGWFLTSSFPRIRLQISRLPFQLWNEPIQLTELRQARASCVNSHAVSDRTTQRWVFKQPPRYHLFSLLEERGSWFKRMTDCWWSTYMQSWKVTLTQVAWLYLNYLKTVLKDFLVNILYKQWSKWGCKWWTIENYIVTLQTHSAFASFVATCSLSCSLAATAEPLSATMRW